ncbi:MULTISPECIES: cell division protein FtsA [Clostridium]|uniref:Cell division protein FtsA n=2 Tax=Clostridium TaxID=1485 RepID=D8GUD3_CLOLD|nr:MULTISPECIES: rod shape-determining protein [Clostridium]ADK14796.1 cell division protein ftsA [Clostridium ljungdahlii DSM 13528]AGY78047.1 rod shape-determining protein [Clostridium autoethanogenum DSM 10061]ALU38181.1 Cell division protein FtsA [Clostridium autoethanogenum DSM 10061]OAA85997.1 Cell division protein FtsA [Clostridium ljungdahlii DSM 13528]OVY50945.1 Cell division protein FtsA [Clostridium autoethanogenum]
MEITNFNPQDVIFALDIGTRTVIGTAGIVKDKKFNIVSEHCVEHEERAMIDGQIHDVGLVANAVNAIKKKIEEDLNMKLENAAIAAAGRFLRTVSVKEDMNIDYDKEIDRDTIRSLELTAVKSAEKQVTKNTKGRLYCVGYSVKSYYLNGYLISNLLAHKGENISVEAIATFLPRSVVDSLYSVMEKVGLQVVSLTLEPIAAMEAAVPQNLRLLNLALVDVGAGTSDIAISSKDTISAYGMVSQAGDEVTEVIAQNYLVDFNTAEKIKKQCNENETIKYTDVLGIESKISSEEVIKLINPVVNKIADEIGNKIVELNGDKPPNAIFLVGGGAHTPELKEFLAKKLNMPLQRIAIKGREAVTDCVCLDNSLGSTGVTVLGIALISIRRLGHGFIDVMLNGNVISLFNSHGHTVMDVMLQAGINPKSLIGKNGKNIRFTVNGIKRVAFGTLASNTKITVNGIEKSMDEEIKEGDDIEIKYAINGKNAVPKVIDYIQKSYSVSFFINDLIENLEPAAYINGNRVKLDSTINEGDNVNIILPETISDYEKYFSTDSGEEFVYYLDGNKLDKKYIINEGDRIYRITKVEDGKEKNSKEERQENLSSEEVALETAPKEEDIRKDKEDELHKSTLDEKSKDTNEITVVANGKTVVLTGKKDYIFVDIFNHIEFDLTKIKGKLYLHLNGNNAGYYDKLSEGDIIELGWE